MARKHAQNTATDPLDRLVSVADGYDSKVRLLFQLRNYISLVKYNPVTAKADKSAEFRRFVSANNLDIWNALQKKADTRKVSKRVNNVRREVTERLQKLHKQPRHQKPRNSAPPKSAPVQSSSEVKKPQAPKSAPAASSASRTSAASSKQATPTPPATPSTPPQKRKAESPLIIDDAELGWPDEVHHTQKRQKREVSLITNPLHFVKPQLGGLRAYLSSFRSITDDLEPINDEQWAKKVDQDADALGVVMHAKLSGKLQRLMAEGIGSEQKWVKFTPPPPTEMSHYDHLMSQGVHYAKLQANLRKYHQSIVKRNTQSVEQYFRRLAGAEERERKELERQVRQIARKTSQEVMKKWRLAEKIVEQRREAVLAEQKREKGKEYLNEILDKSAKLIESRIGDISSGESSGGESSDNSEEEESSDGDDEELPLEKLKEKYKDLPNIPSEESEESEDESEMESEMEMEKPSEEALRIYAETAAASDEEESDSSEGSDSESESESEMESEDERPGLAALLGGGPIDDESDYEAEDEDEDEAKDEDEVEDETKSEDESEDESKSEAKVEDESKSEAKIEDEPEDKSKSEPKSEDEAKAEPKSEDDPKSEADPEPKVEDQPKSEAEDEPKVEDEPEDQHMSDPETKSDRPLGLHRIEPPFLLKGQLREYQRNGLDWLAGLVQSGTNGILADEMGLGKTIQTIALLCWLACERHIWGPHLIVVPTSVMLNWEMEFKRFAPGFKILTYFGTPQQRKRKRRGWNKEDTWHVCITSYQLVIQDQVVFRNKRWQFMVLDEAHNIKNFRSQRWQALLNFNAQYRLLLTGTPLQNNLVELWSLLYFLMPSSRATQMMPAGFASLDDFQEWFAKPVDQMVEEGEEADDEARATISKLHQVLRPYLLRRLKVDVEKQMPGKYEHVVYCRLSKRQRYLYDDFMSRASTRATLESGNFMSILNCLMQLRKVCNHPDLFEVRPIVTSYAIDDHVGKSFRTNVVPRFKLDVFSERQRMLESHNLVPTIFETKSKQFSLLEKSLGNNSLAFEQELEAIENDAMVDDDEVLDLETVEGWAKHLLLKRRLERIHRKQALIRLNNLRNSRVPIFGTDCLNLLRVFKQPIMGVKSYLQREIGLHPALERFAFVTPAVTVLDLPQEMLGPVASIVYNPTLEPLATAVRSPLFHEPQVRLSVAFPDKRLLQYDCGKLQKLAILLQDLISHGHRCLIFTQMTRVLDILEQFLNLHGWRYLRLDGATHIEQRQALTERFNKDSSIPVFILSTRSGGLGINLTGADTVIFYDSDWNPAMDRQCQDRCHRIGQTRDVHIYRLVSEFTIESNILRKATQKTILDNVVIQEGEFTTEYFSKLSVQDILGNDAGRNAPAIEELEGAAGPKRLEAAMAQAEDRDDQLAANLALNEAKMDQDEFNDVSTKPSSEPTETQEVQEDQPEVRHIDDWMIYALEHYDL